MKEQKRTLCRTNFHFGLVSHPTELLYKLILICRSASLPLLSQLSSFNACYSNQLDSYLFAMLNASHLKRIKSNPIEDRLASFCDVFRLTCADLGIPESVDRVRQIDQGGDVH